MEKKEFFLNFEGYDIHCVQWIPEGEIRAVLQIVHGMLEYADRYHDFASFLCKNGIAVVGHDRIGHGKTAADEGELGYIKKEGGRDLLTRSARFITGFIKKNFSTVPNYILGHSMGSFVLRKYMTEYSDSIDGAIVMGTADMPVPVLLAGRFLASLIGSIYGGRHPSQLLTDISFAGYNKGIPKEEGIHGWISSDREIVNKYDKDPFCSYTFKADGFFVLYDTLYYLARGTNSDKVRKDLPVFVCSGGADPVGAYGRSPEKVYRRYKEDGLLDVTLKIYENDRHEILNEKDRENVSRDILSWIEARIK